MDKAESVKLIREAAELDTGNILTQGDDIPITSFIS